MFNEIVENQNLLRNKDEFWKNLKTKNSYFFLFKRLYILEVYLQTVFAVKHMVLKMCDLHTDKVIHRGGFRF